jgi:lipid-binding SYLF domain-containing protein
MSTITGTEQTMKAPAICLAVVILPTLFAANSFAAPRPWTTIENAAETVNDLSVLREKGVAPALLRDADAVIIAPNVVKGGFVVAARHGHGVVLLRDKEGGWSSPIFITITGGSFGFQAGVQANDLFLVVRSRRSLERILHGNGKLTLGADASIAAGPVGRQASAATDAQMRAEMLSYSRGRGVFAGAALEGDTVLIDWDANEKFYGKRGITVADIVGGKVSTPESAILLRDKLARWPGASLESGPRLPARLGDPRIP